MSAVIVNTEPADPNALYLVELLATGSADGFTFELDRGIAGLNFVLTLKKDGQQIGKETLDLRPLVSSWVGALVERASK